MKKTTKFSKFFGTGVLALSLFMSINLKAQEVISLYGGAIPGAKPTPADYLENDDLSKDGTSRITKVTKPELHIFKPQKPNGTAVIICPGGGYSLLAFDKEGLKVAQQFQQIGVTAFVLKYRLPSDLIMQDKTLGPLQDALQAIYLVRKNALALGVKANKVGIMGFSAGGHLAATASTHFADLKIDNKENVSLRPDFSILIYPVITFGQYTHAGSVGKLLGVQPTEAQLKYFSLEKQVTTQTPPTFLVHANNDAAVPVQNSLRYNEALVKNGVAAEMHIYQAGGHGFGLNNKTTKDKWFDRLTNWMEVNKF